MKFMVTFRVHPDKRQAAFAAFSQMTAEDDKRDMGDKIKLIGRWHDLSQFSGVAICESDDPQALASWALNWNNILDSQTVMVLDDEEARAVGKKKLEELANAKPAAIAN
jgi:uncharacterized protein DUF3303